MKLFGKASLSITLVTWSVVAFCQDSQQVLATVTLSVVDAFGQQQSGCHVEKFISHENGAKADLKGRFHDLVGVGIPFGMDYDVGVKCSDQGSVGFSTIAVRRDGQFIVLTAGPLREDYYTGVSPRLSVLADPISKKYISGHRWVEVLGVFSDFRETDRIDSETKMARFYYYGLVPGKYVMLLFDGDKSVCTIQLDILGPEARLALSVSEQGCEAKGLNAVKVISD
jgi:hypothetical protein